MYSPFFFKDIKLSVKPGWKDKQLDLLGKYKIKEVPDKILSKLLRVLSQREYKGQKKSGPFQLLQNTVAAWKTFWLCQKVRPLFSLPPSTISGHPSRSCQDPKNGDEKVRKRKKKKNKSDYWGGRREIIEKKGGISEVSIYYYEIYE